MTLFLRSLRGELGARDPEGVEARGHAIRQRHAGHGLGSHGLGVEDVEGAGLGRLVEHERDQVAVVLVLGLAGLGRDEEALAGDAARRELEQARGLRPGKVHLEDAAARDQRAGLEGAQVPVARAAAHEVLRHDGEVHDVRLVVEDDLLRDATRREVDGVAAEHAALAVGEGPVIVREAEVELGYLAGHERDAIGVAVVVLPRVEDVEDHVRRGLDPDDVGGVRLELAHDAEAHGLVVVEDEGQLVRAAQHGLGVEDQAGLDEDDVVARDGAVVHHDRPGQRDVELVHDAGAGVE
eukprot:CAMPEP_0202075016 /NCGR_PEP_ID=MMETSP0964-20121228/3956_1 /ASSEMBLY_ACC=CAM_ASM_000500 /TAXON_ID=4773 /ORGANISM="Schizochytrium aggregatum, Strain ATCC28209" /LENGTH=294 /DNA_ID=CAMNT_0048642191 /DNA_START=135 /DNA_END=1016 /DNA_ORIENTATION=+